MEWVLWIAVVVWLAYLSIRVSRLALQHERFVDAFRRLAWSRTSGSLDKAMEREAGLLSKQAGQRDAADTDAVGRS